MRICQLRLWKSTSTYSSKTLTVVVWLVHCKQNKLLNLLLNEVIKDYNTLMHAYHTKLTAQFKRLITYHGMYIKHQKLLTNTMA